MIAFDRLWSVYLSTKFKFTLNKLHLTGIILVMLLFVACMNIFQFWTYSSTITYENITYVTCRLPSVPRNIAFIQDIMISITRSVLPFFLIAILSIVLIIKVRQAKKRSCWSSSSPSSLSQLRELRFTIAVCFINGWFLLLNLPFLGVFLQAYVLRAVMPKRTQLVQSQLSLFSDISVLFCYAFTLLEFWRDLVFNRIFRKEIATFVYFITRRDHIIAANKSSIRKS